MRGGLDRAVEWLRPLVDAKDGWDFCVVWKLRDGSTKYIEWIGCCCSGCNGGTEVKQESLIGKQFESLCRDVHFKHAISTKACQALQQFPSIMPLYSGRIEGEVAISNQPRWFINGKNALDSSTSSSSPHEWKGTRVIIPVFGGLVELFSSKQKAKDQQIIDFITAQCSDSTEQVMTTPLSANESVSNENFKPQVVDNLQYYWSPYQHCFLMPNMQIHLPVVTELDRYPSFEGSSVGSKLLSEVPSFDLNYCSVTRNEPMKPSIFQSVGSDGSSHYHKLMLKEHTDLVLGCDNKVATCSKRANQKRSRENFQAKNLVTERNRRNRIKDGLLTLRSLVPKITKMDRAATLADAIEYVGELHQELRNLKEELKEIEEKELNERVKFKSTSSNELHEGDTSSAEHNKSSGDSSKKRTEVLLEVHEIKKGDFLIKLLSEQKRGGFARLMETLNASGIKVVDANITTFDDKVLNILKVEVQKEEIQLKNLRELLMVLTR